MGFSIGRFLKKAVAAVAPIVGASFGPIGGLIGTGFAAALAPSRSRPTPTFTQAITRRPLPQPIGGASMVHASLASGPQFLSRLPKIIGPLLPGLGAAGAVSLMGQILEMARQNTGRRVTKRQIITAAKVCGIGLAAQSFGLSESQVCQVIAAGAPRRRRGISAADLRRTRATIRKVHTIQRDLKALGSGRK